jgi:hypothetical protein
VNHRRFANLPEVSLKINRQSLKPPPPPKLIAIAAVLGIEVRGEFAAILALAPSLGLLGRGNPVFFFQASYARFETVNLVGECDESFIHEFNFKFDGSIRSGVMAGEVPSDHSRNGGMFKKISP